jgi:glutathione peroxidase
MKIVLLILGAMIVIGVGVSIFVLRGALAGGVQEPAGKVAGRLWDLETSTLEGKPAPLKDWEGQVALVVNVASKCGLTPQYEGLEALYRGKKDQGFVVLGFPSNDFRGQEPGTPAEIRTFCSTKYDVTFPLFAKVKVTGDEKDGIYRWLCAGGLEEPTWNFTKYLVGRDGKVIARYAPKTAPDDKELVAAIDAALAR